MAASGKLPSEVRGHNLTFSLPFNRHVSGRTGAAIVYQECPCLFLMPHWHGMDHLSMCIVCPAQRAEEARLCLPASEYRTFPVSPGVLELGV